MIKRIQLILLRDLTGWLSHQGNEGPKLRQRVVEDIADAGGNDLSLVPSANLPPPWTVPRQPSLRNT